MKNSVSVDPSVVQAAVDGMTPADRRSDFIESAWKSVHSLFAKQIDQEVLLAKVKRRLECWHGGTPNQCPDPPRRCWCCNRCYGLATASVAKVRMDLETIKEGLIQALLDVEVDAELLKRGMGR
jgi:hypothetical protein